MYTVPLHLRRLSLRAREAVLCAGMVFILAGQLTAVDHVHIDDAEHHCVTCQQVDTSVLSEIPVVPLLSGTFSETYTNAGTRSWARLHTVHHHSRAPPHIQ